MRFERQSTALREARKNSKLTQTQVSNKLGIAPQQYNNFENGKVGIPAKYVKSLEKLFKVKLLEAITDDFLEHYSRKIGH